MVSRDLCVLGLALVLGGPFEHAQLYGMPHVGSANPVQIRTGSYLRDVMGVSHVIHAIGVMRVGERAYCSGCCG